MLSLEGMNIWAVLVVWLVYMIIGAWWYSPGGFAKKWTAYTGIDIMKLPNTTKIIQFVAVSALVQSFTLGIILNSLHVTSVVNSVVATIIIWFGLVAATTVGVTLYGKRGWKFLWLNASYFLVVMVIAAVIFSVWK